jgi:hypothetical protein
MKIQKEYTGMNFDQWNMFLQFNYHITLDFENYDENCAWPVMIDDFVAFMKDEVLFDKKLLNVGRIIIMVVVVVVVGRIMVH